MICDLRALSMTPVPSGATMGHGPRWSRPCANGPAWKRVVSPPAVPRAWIANRSRPPRWEVLSVGMMVARKSTAASGICWSRRWACCVPSSFPVPVWMMVGRHRPGSVRVQPHNFPRLVTIFADQKDHNHALDAWMAEPRAGWRIAVKARPAGTQGFTPLEKRWVIERTNAWPSRDLRNSKDYE